MLLYLLLEGALKISSMKLIVLFLVSIFAATTQLSAEEKAVITGNVVKQENGDPLIGARVFLKDAKKGAISKMGGKYRIKNIKPGTYTLVCTYVGFEKFEVANVKVAAGETKSINISMVTKTTTSQTVVVTAKAIKNNGAALLKDRQKATAMSDAIGAEEISRGGASDAGDAIKKVTGATTDGGKYVYIRGLGDRYASTQLNGAQLPSADPDKRSVHLDLFPTNLIENIVTTKTATPDKPGDFTGGAVNIATKSFPDKFRASFSLSSSYNTQTTGKDMLTYGGSGTDWLGFDDGKRSIPDAVQQVIDNPDLDVPYLQDTWMDKDKAQLLDNLSKSFDPQMSPTTKSAPINRSFSANVGDQVELFGSELGYVASFSYGRKFKSYDNGINAFYSLSGASDEVTSLTDDNVVSDRKSTDEVLWGAMANLSYNLTQNNQISVNYMYNQSGESTARYQEGYDRYYGLDRIYETRVLGYVERNMSSLQFSGKHNMPSVADSKLDWQVSLSQNTQDEPDLRFFTNDYYVDEETGEKTYDIDQSLYKFPSRYFRNLSEDLNSVNLNYEVPLEDFAGNSLKFKVGTAYTEKTRAFQEFRFDLAQDKINYDGDADGFFKNNTGIIDSSSSFPRFGNYIQFYDPTKASYDGEQSIGAGYGMIDWTIPFVSNFRIIGGVRYESTDITVTSRDTSKAVGELSEQDWLPSVNMVYGLNEKMNLRFAYGKTIARPNFREFAPYSSFEYVGGYILLGNAELERTKIDNYDIRWEYFSQPGEILAVSLFYKDFTNPIERVIINVNKEIQYKNVETASLYGAEFEFRKQLGFLGEWANNFQIGTNVTLVQSSVDISEEELKVIQAYDPNAKTTRELQGQSPFIVNVDFAYVDFANGTEASITYNIFGKRLSEVTEQGTPDVYEYSRPDLGLVFSQKLLDKLKLKISAKNILDSDIKKAQEFKGKEYITQQYSLGRSFSVGISYSFD